MAMSNHAFKYLALSVISILIFMLFYTRTTNVPSLNEIQPLAQLYNFTPEAKKDEELVFLKPFLTPDFDFFLAIDYKVQGCTIAKSMSQLTYNTICYLDNAKAFADKNLTFSSTWYDDRSHCLNISKKSHQEEIDSGKINLTEFVKFAFVRDPMDRFRSFYMDKCLREKVCGECKDVLCAAKKSYETLKTFMKTREFEEETRYMTSHAAPQTWNCDFGRTLHDYTIIQIGASIEERRAALEKLADVLRTGNVPERHVERILKDALTAETAHSTHNRNESHEVMNEIENNPEVRNYLHHMYYYDYIAFGLNMTGLDESYRIK